MKVLTAEFVISAAAPRQFLVDSKPQIAFVGRSNVGKSSLINALVHRKNLVKTSATPGKTQLVNYFVINGQFYFVDLPGYGYAKVPRAVSDAWAPMIETYLKDTKSLALVVALFDARRVPDERDLALIDWLSQYQVPSVVVMTKTDKLNRRETDEARKTVAETLGVETMLLSSAKSGQGVKELWGEIMTAIRG